MDDEKSRLTENVSIEQLSNEHFFGDKEQKWSSNTSG